MGTRGKAGTVLLVLVGILTIGAVAGGCAPRPQKFWSRPAPDSLPEPVRQWVENSLPLDAGQWRTEGDKTYVLVTWGERPAGEYKVEIIDVTRSSDDPNVFLVTIRYTEPSAGTGTGGPTRPYDLVVIDASHAGIKWSVEGKPDAYVMGVYGDVQPIVAGSRWIKLFTPAPGSSVASPFTLSGLASVYEGTVNYRLTVGDEVLTEGYATAMMGDWGSFSVDVAYELPEGAVDPTTGAVAGTLEVFWYSPEDGSEVDKIVVPLTLGG